MSYKTPYLSAVGEYFHVYNRGTQKGPIFDSPANYEYFLSRVHIALDMKGVKIMCYCLMPNHFHFLLKQNEPQGISRFMQSIGNSYSKALNRQRGQTGHVFESKYKIKLIETEGYLVWLSRYIHRNPREAGLVSNCSDWKYSSYLGFMDTSRRSNISPEVILSAFSSREDYRQFVESNAQDEPEGFMECLF